MSRINMFALLAIAAFVVCSVGISVNAQQTSTPAIIVKSASSTSPKAVKTRFEVVHMVPNSIQVRSLANGFETHTFVYSDRIRDRMQAIFDQGGYQYGDKVEIWYLPGTDIALRIKGRPSKPL
jgi:hypothetical protein